MKNRSSSYHIEDSLLFKVFSLVFFVGLITYAGYQLKLKRDAGLLESARQLEVIENRLGEAYRAAGSFHSATFRETARDSLARMDALLALAISSPDGVPLYTIARSQQLLARHPREGIEFRIRPVLTEQVTRPFPPNRTAGRSEGSPAAESLRADALVQVLGREAVVPVLRDVLIILLAFLVAVVLFILIALSVSPRNRPQDDGFLDREPPPPDSGPDWEEETDFRPEHEDAGSTREESPAESPPPPKQSLFSPATGLVWGEYLRDRLQYELERSASFDQDLTLAFIAPDPVHGATSAEAGQACLRTSRAVLEKFPFRDLTFEGGDSCLALILPDKHLDQAIAELESFRKLVQEVKPGEDRPARPFTVSVGLSARNGRLIGQQVLHREALAALRRAVREGGNRLTAFRADPDKFRKVVTSLH